MKTYYQVISSFDDNGTVAAAIVGTIQAAEIPESNYISTRYFDIYSDWFESAKEAQAFISAAEEA